MRQLLNYNTSLGGYLFIIMLHIFIFIFRLDLCFHCFKNGMIELSRAYWNYQFSYIDTCTRANQAWEVSSNVDRSQIGHKKETIIKRNNRIGITMKCHTPFVCISIQIKFSFATDLFINPILYQTMLCKVVKMSFQIQ